MTTIRNKLEQIYFYKMTHVNNSILIIIVYKYTILYTFIYLLHIVHSILNQSILNINNIFILNKKIEMIKYKNKS